MTCFKHAVLLCSLMAVYFLANTHAVPTAFIFGPTFYSLPLATTASASYELCLGTKPTADVTLTISTMDTNVVSFSGTTVTFTSQNYFKPQSFYFLTMLYRPAQIYIVASGPPEYDGQALVVYFNIIPAQVLSVQRSDTEFPLITSPLAVPTPVSFYLNVKPSSEVTVTVSNPLGSVTPSTITFNSEDFFVPKTVKFTYTSMVSGLLTATASQSGGNSEFDGMFTDVFVSTLPLSALLPTPRTYAANVAEGYKFPVNLTAPPTDVVTISVTSDTPSCVATSAVLHFTQDNWYIPQYYPVSTLAAGVATLTFSATASSAPEYIPSNFKITVAEREVRFIAKSVYFRDTSSGSQSIILSAEPTSPVTCTGTSPDSWLKVTKDAVLEGWHEEDELARAWDGWGNGEGILKFASSSALGGKSSIFLTCSQPDGAKEFDGLSDTLYVAFRVSSGTVFQVYQNPSGGMRGAIYLGSSPMTSVYPVGISGPSSSSTTPTCSDSNLKGIGTLSFPSGTNGWEPTLTPIKLGTGYCQVTSQDANYKDQNTFYSLTVARPQLFPPRIVKCTLHAAGCAIQVTFGNDLSTSTTVTISSANPSIVNPVVASRVASAGDTYVNLNVNPLAEGYTTVTAKFTGSEYHNMEVQIGVVVTPAFIRAVPRLTGTNGRAFVDIWLSGFATSGTRVEFSCTYPSGTNIFSDAVIRTGSYTDSMGFEFTDWGVFEVTCDAVHMMSTGAPAEYAGKQVKFYVESMNADQSYDVELVVSPAINLFSQTGIPAIGTVAMGYQLDPFGSVEEVEITLTVEDPTIATIDTSKMIFTKHSWSFIQTFTATGVSRGVTRVVLSGTKVDTNYITIMNVPALSAVLTVTQPQCFGDLGSVNVDSVTGSGGYTYTWLPQGTASDTSTTSLSGLHPGDYSLELRDSKSTDPFVAKFTIDPVPDPISGEWSTHTDITCNGANDGVLGVTAHGGSGSYTYTWTGTSGTSSATGLGPGPYSVVIGDSRNCPSFSVTATTIKEPAAMVLTTEQTDVLCRTAATGSANVSVSGGVGQYTYAWQSPLSSTDDHVEALTAGSYVVIVKDGNHCPKQATVTITQPAAVLSVHVDQTDVACGGEATGEIRLTVSGGITDYTYSWIPAVSQSDIASNLLAGDYKYTVTDANKCEATQTITVIQPNPLVAKPSKVDVVCNGASTGKVQVDVTGGSGTPQYAWLPSTLGNGPSALNLPAGIYLSTVTDSKGCSVIQNITVTQPDAFSINANYTPIKCHNGYTTLQANPVGGTAPFTFSWSPAGGNNYTSSLVPAGIYRISATDSCTTSSTQSVIVPNPTPISLIASQINVGCNGDHSGSATVYASGGTPGYTYEWAPYGGNKETATGLSAGTFNVTVTDANGCQSFETYIITEPPPVTFTYTTTPVKCYGAATGSATVTVQGGGKRYLYEWNPDVSIGPTASNLLAGNYEVTVTDSKFCSSTQDIVIYQPGAPLTIGAFQTNALCYGGTGTAKAIVSGGTPGYTYSWSPSGGDKATANDLQPGTYVLTVTDANGCTRTQSYTITQPAPLVIGASQRNVTCQGSSTGMATAKVSGGTPKYNYSWTGITATSATVTGLVSGEYTLTVIDANKCNITQTYTIAEPASAGPLSVNLTSKVDNVCKGSSSGSIQVAAVGGVEGNYSYKWSTGETNNTLTNLTAGTYKLTVLDLAGCSKQYFFNITEPEVQFCQNNATCVAAESCICQTFWNGTDCSIPVCPVGCANNGTCTGPNQCTCAPGFTGLYCQKSAASSQVIELQSVLLMAGLMLVLLMLY